MRPDTKVARKRIERERDVTLRAIERQLVMQDQCVSSVASAGEACACGCGEPATGDRVAIVASYSNRRDQLAQQLVDARAHFEAKLDVCDEEEREWQARVAARLDTMTARDLRSRAPKAVTAAATKPPAPVRKAALRLVGEAAAVAETRRVMAAAPSGTLVAAPDGRTGRVTGTEWRSRDGS